MRRVVGMLPALLFLAACGSAAATGSPITDTSPAPATATPAAAPTDGTTPSAAVHLSFPAGKLTIATLGDSLTEGQGDDTGLGYTGRLKALIDPLRPGTTIVNVGHSGWTSTDLIKGQNGTPSELDTALEAHPNVACVWIGSNDLWYLYEYGPEPMTAEAEREDLAGYEANVSRILHELVNHGAVVFIALLDDQSKRPVATTPGPDGPAFPATTRTDLALMSAHVRAYNDIIRRVAAENGATTVDFYGTTVFTDAATLHSDGNHPNEAGYVKIAQLWFEAIEPGLRA
jgi:lysophospholipase L1-like esterase